MDTSMYATTAEKGIKANRDRSEILLDFKLNKKRYRKKISYSKEVNHSPKDRLKMARVALDAYKEEIKSRATLGNVAKLTMDDYFQRTQENSNRSLAVKKYMAGYYTKYIKPFVGTLLVKDVRSTHITSIANNLKKQKFTLSTRKKSLEVLTPIFKMAIDEDVITKSPIKNIHKIKRDASKEKKIILGAEGKYRLVYNQIHKTFEHNPKIKALILFCFHGRRRNEAMALKWSDIDLGNNTYLVRGTNSKVKMDMLFALPADIAIILSELPRLSEYLFYSESNMNNHVVDIRHHVHKLRDDCNLPELTLHWLRNLAVSALSGMGVGALELSTMLGHTDPNTLRQYLTMQRQASTMKIDKISQKHLTS